MTDDGGAGASSARRKLARSLKNSLGIPIESSGPPTDDDFIDAILRYSQGETRTISFNRYHDRIGIPVPQSALDSLIANPGTLYRVLDTETVTGSSRGRYKGAFFLTWIAESNEFVLLHAVSTRLGTRPNVYHCEFEWDE